MVSPVRWYVHATVPSVRPAQSARVGVESVDDAVSQVYHPTAGMPGDATGHRIAEWGPPLRRGVACWTVRVDSSKSNLARGVTPCTLHLSSSPYPRCSSATNDACPGAVQWGAISLFFVWACGRARRARLSVGTSGSGATYCRSFQREPPGCPTQTAALNPARPLT